MNERLSVIAAQVKLNGVEFDGVRYYVGTEETFLAFAKLIIRECAKIADIADENECEWIGGNILTHFGVKE